MRAIVRLIHEVQVANFWRKSLIYIVIGFIGFTVTLLIPSQSNSYPIKEHQIGLSSQLTDYDGSRANNVQVDLSNSDCARVFFNTLSQHMKPTFIEAQWSSGRNIYNFMWSASTSKPSTGSIALKSSLRSSALDKASGSKENTIELAQMNITHQVNPALVRAVRSSGASLRDYSVRGTKDGIPCCGSSRLGEVFYGGC